MKYYIVTFTVEPNTEAARDLLAALAGEAGFETFEETESGLNGYVQQSMFNSETLDEVIASFPLPNTTIGYSVQEADDKDWNEAWEREGFEPITIPLPSSKLIIHDGRHLPENTYGATLIQIDAKQAFGTGTHDTTQMMVGQLASMSLQGLRVLDCGCGTGILGIAAAKLHAREVVAYDIDEWSVENTRHNAALNKVELDVLHGDAQVLTHVSGLFDVVLANINRNILLEDMPCFKELMAANATLIMSGFYKDDVPLLIDKASQLGLIYEGTRAQGEWRCIVLKN